MLRSVSHIRNKYTLASSPRLTLNRKELVEEIHTGSYLVNYYVTLSCYFISESSFQILISKNLFSETLKRIELIVECMHEF